MICSSECSVYGRGRNLDKAVKMFDTARSRGISLDEKAYTNIICYLGKAGINFFFDFIAVEERVLNSY